MSSEAEADAEAQAQADSLAVVLPAVVKRLEADEAGRQALRTLAGDETAVDDLSRWLTARGSPTIANIITGGVVGKLVNIAHADVVQLPPERIVERPSQLPNDIGDFTDRTSTIEAMLAAARAADAAPPRATIFSISGVGGSGKSALAIHVSHLLRDARPDAQLYVSLRGAETFRLDPSYVLDQFLRALGVEGALIPAAVDDRARMYRAALANRAVLVLLDNAADEAQVRPLLPGGPGAVVIITSRAPLAAIEGAAAISLDVLEPDQAVELLTNIVGPDRVGVEPEAAREVVELCGSLPLAIRVAGAKLLARPHWRVELLARRLRDERRRLHELSAGDLDVRGTFMLSYRGLDDDLQRAFRLSSQVAGVDFPAWTVAALLDTDEDTAQELAEQLVEAQLFEVSGEDATGEIRYRLHDLVRVFARERLEETEAESERHDAVERALGAQLTLAKQALFRLSPHSKRDPVPSLARLWPVDPRSIDRMQAEPYAWFSAEYAGLIAGIRQAHREELWECAWELADAMHFFFRVRALWTDWQETHELALEAAERAGNLRGLAWTLRNLGNAHRDQRHMSEARACFLRSLETFRGLGNRLGEAAALNNLGELAMDRGDLDEAVDYFEACLPAWAEVDDQVGVAYVNNHLGVIRRRQGRWPEAQSRFDRSSAMFGELGDRLGAAFALLSIADLRIAEGRLDEADEALDRSTPTFTELGDHVSETWALLSRARIRVEQDRLPEASDLSARVLQTFRDLGLRVGEAWALVTFGDLSLANGHHIAAAAAFEESVAAFVTLEDRLGEGVGRLGLGRVQMAQQDRDRARATIEAAAERFREIGAAGWQAEAERLLG